MEALVDRLKTFRQGNPLSCQRFWDVIRQIRADRKAANPENVVRIFSEKFNFDDAFVRQELELLVEDKLIVEKKSSVNRDDEQVVYCIPVSISVTIFYIH